MDESYLILYPGKLVSVIIWTGPGQYYARMPKKYGKKLIFRKAKRKYVNVKKGFIHEFSERPEEYILLSSGYSSIVCATR